MSQLIQFRYFLDLPPEIRNAIYDLVLLNDHHISITSARKRVKIEQTPLRTAFGCLLRVNKQVNWEAKTVFYSSNTFAVGNGWWGSRRQENVQALKQFLQRVPKDCIGMIRHLHVIIFPRGREGEWVRYYSFSAVDADIEPIEMQEFVQLGRALLKHFVGVEHLTLSVAAFEEHGASDDKAYMSSGVKKFAMEVRKTLDGFASKRLKDVCWVKGRVELDKFIGEVNHEKLEEKVTTNFMDWKDIPYAWPPLPAYNYNGYW